MESRDAMEMQKQWAIIVNKWHRQQEQGKKTKEGDEQHLHCEETDNPSQHTDKATTKLTKTNNDFM